MSATSLTVRQLREMKAEGRKISVLTSYDASMTRLMEAYRR
jgi:ketopantoate hydroxymethyltransferase